MASRAVVLSRLVSRVIHSPRSSIFRPLLLSDDKQCPSKCMPDSGKMGALYPDPIATIFRGVHSSVPIWKPLPGKTGVKGDFRYYPNHYVYAFAVVPNPDDDRAAVEPYVSVPALVPPDHPGAGPKRKQVSLKEFKGGLTLGAGASDAVRGRFEYDDSEMESEEGLWELYKRWQLHFFGENDDKEKRNSRNFKKFKESAQFTYDLNKIRGLKASTRLNRYAAVYTPVELARARRRPRQIGRIGGRRGVRML